MPKINLKGKNFYKYDFISGQTFSSITDIDKEFNQFLKWALKNLWKRKKLHSIQKVKFKNNCHNFYYEKTFNRINMMKSKNILIDKINTINNKICRPLEKLLKKIDWIKICDGNPTNFHGDLHFENIIKTGTKYKLLDWRESFDNLIHYGDIYYDFAKLNHGFIINHSLISENNFKVTENNKKVDLSYVMTKEYEKCQKILLNLFKITTFHFIR